MKKKRGRPPKTDAAKALAATLRSYPCREAKGRPTSRMKPGTGRTPPAPAWLPPELHLRWRRYCRLLIAARRLTPGHLDLLAVYLALDREIAKTFASGQLPKNSHLGRHQRLAERLGLERDLERKPAASLSPECG